jgi:hypothetical protein
MTMDPEAMFPPREMHPSTPHHAVHEEKPRTVFGLPVVEDASLPTPDGEIVFGTTLRGTVVVGQHTHRVTIPRGYAWYVREHLDRAMEAVTEFQRLGKVAREEDAEYVLLVTPHSPVPEGGR